MGRTHAMTGLAAASLAGPLLSVTDPRVLLVLGAVGAGATLLPDLDTRSSTAARALGPVSQAVSRAARRLSEVVWAATATRLDREDPRPDTGHRHLTHTLPACGVFGVLAWVACLLAGAVAGWVLGAFGGPDAAVFGPRAGVAVVCGALAVPAARLVLLLVPGVGRAQVHQGVVAAGAVVAAAAAWAEVAAWVVGVGVCGGALLGVLGDALTPHGVPLSWPRIHRGRRWFMHRTRWTFPAKDDSRPEKCVRALCWAGTAAGWVLLFGFG
ncbi:metal-dependent hydrolase [Nocardiopsis changdeensis]|uniref:metal-dependent hydrolase n=1 Tax=Nocardiopsis changdeensis TaxID=2831969 RepID=UPI003F473259